MSYHNLPEDLLLRLGPSEVRQYAMAHGWERVEGVNGKIALYRHPESDLDQLIVPLDTAMDDYGLGMADVITRLAEWSEQSPLQVLDDLLRCPSDVLRLRLSAPDAALGSLPLHEGLRLFRGGRDILLSAACSTVEPRPFHPLDSLRRSSGFIKSCRLGQTERGSFVATIITPIQSLFHQEVMPFDEEEPFARRVTTRLMGSLSVLGEAVECKQIDPIVGAVERGVSANLCEAVVAMRPKGDQSRLEVAMKWWSQGRPRVPDDVPKAVTFARKDFEIIEEAGRVLRERAEPRRETFVGKVHALQHGDLSLFDDLVGKIVIRATIGGRALRIKVVLNRDDYSRACDAHRDGKRVAVTGLIHHDVKVKVYELSEPRDFQVLDEG